MKQPEQYTPNSSEPRGYVDLSSLNLLAAKDETFYDYIGIDPDTAVRADGSIHLPDISKSLTSTAEVVAAERKADKMARQAEIARLQLAAQELAA